MKVLTVVGAEAQLAQAAMVSRQLDLRGRQQPYEEVVIHTGLAASLDPLLMERLGAHVPSAHLGIIASSPTRFLARLIEGVEEAIRTAAPDAVMTYADTPATLATAIASAQLDIPLVHVEAGERVFRRRQIPEEVQRVLTDHASWLCLTSTQRSAMYLRREGMAPNRVRFVGDPTYDLFRFVTENLDRYCSLTLGQLDLEPGEYHLATIHSPRNTADPAVFLRLLETLDRADRPVVMTVNPLVRALLDSARWTPNGQLRLVPQLGLFDFLRLLLDCRNVVTDSGRVTREAFFALKPCIVPLEDVWWPEIAEAGWAVQTGDDADALLQQMASYVPPNPAPEGLFGDGSSAELIVAEVERLLDVREDSEGPFHLHGAFEQLPKATASSFTYRNYRTMLQSFLDAGYQFRRFSEVGPEASDSPVVLLRHDIDLDLRKALSMAEVEAAMGVQATYFVLLRTEHYNIFSPDQSELVRRIIALGHDLALHFDCAAYPDPDSAAALAAACSRESQLLEEWFEHPVTIVSYHRPSALVLTGDPALSAPRPHTYMPRFTRAMRYCSDSRGRWQSDHPLETDAFRARQHMHILVHPIWWDERPVSPYECLLQYVDEKHRSLEQSIARNSMAYRVGWLSEELERVP